MIIDDIEAIAKEYKRLQERQAQPQPVDEPAAASARADQHDDEEEKFGYYFFFLGTRNLEQ